jgi:hypothetical protein
MVAGRNSATERLSDDALLWVDPDNEWVLQEAELILRAVADSLRHQAGTDGGAVLAWLRPPSAVEAPSQSQRLRRIAHEHPGRATQRAPPRGPRDIGAQRAQPARKEVSAIDSSR